MYFYYSNHCNLICGERKKALMVFKLIKQENLHFITDFNIYIFNFIEQIIIYIFRNDHISSFGILYLWISIQRNFYQNIKNILLTQLLNTKKSGENHQIFRVSIFYHYYFLPMLSLLQQLHQLNLL